MSEVYNTQLLNDLANKIYEKEIDELYRLAKTKKFFNVVSPSNENDKDIYNDNLVFDHKFSGVYKDLMEGTISDFNRFDQYIKKLIDLFIKICTYNFSNDIMRKAKHNNKEEMETSNNNTTGILDDCLKLFEVNDTYKIELNKNYESILNAEKFLKRLALILDPLTESNVFGYYTWETVADKFPYLELKRFNYDNYKNYLPQNSEQTNSDNNNDNKYRNYIRKLEGIDDSFFKYLCYAQSQRNTCTHTQAGIYIDEYVLKKDRDMLIIFYLKLISNTYKKLISIFEENNELNNDVKNVDNYFVEIPWVDKADTNTELNIDDLLKSEPKYVKIVMGNAGCGKTTALKELCYKAMKAKENSYIPIFISLANVESIDESMTFKSFVSNNTQYLSQIENNLFDQNFENGRFLIALDGVDEVEKSLRDRLLTFIKNQIINKQNIKNMNQIFISTRIRIEEIFDTVNSKTLLYDQNKLNENRIKSLIEKHCEDKKFDLNKVNTFYTNNSVQLNKLLKTPYMVENFIEACSNGEINKETISNSAKFYQRYIDIIINREYEKTHVEFLNVIHDLLVTATTVCKSDSGIVRITIQNFSKLLEYLHFEESYSPGWNYFIEKCTSMHLLKANSDRRSYTFYSEEIEDALSQEALEI